MKPIITVLAALSLCVIPASISTAKPHGFYMEQLPKGANVTIGQPATTFVKLKSRVQLKPTDLPQTLSFRAINIQGGSASTIEVAIYDRNSDRVKYLRATKDVPALYKVENLEAITIVPKLPGLQGKYPNLRLKVESDKPLYLAR